MGTCDSILTTTLIFYLCRSHKAINNVMAVCTAITVCSPPCGKRKELNPFLGTSSKTGSDVARAEGKGDSFLTYITQHCLFWCRVLSSSFQVFVTIKAQVLLNRSGVQIYFPSRSRKWLKKERKPRHLSIGSFKVIFVLNRLHR